MHDACQARIVLGLLRRVQLLAQGSQLLQQRLLGSARPLLGLLRRVQLLVQGSQLLQQRLPGSLQPLHAAMLLLQLPLRSTRRLCLADELLLQALLGSARRQPGSARRLLGRTRRLQLLAQGSQLCLQALLRSARLRPLTVQLRVQLLLGGIRPLQRQQVLPAAGRQADRQHCHRRRCCLAAHQLRACHSQERHGCQDLPLNGRARHQPLNDACRLGLQRVRCAVA